MLEEWRRGEAGLLKTVIDVASRSIQIKGKLENLRKSLFRRDVRRIPSEIYM